MTDYTLDGGQWDALVAAASASPAGLGADHELACNVNDSEHLHFRRVGVAGSGLAARVAFMAHGAQGHAIVYLAGPEVRALAADLLNAADEIDGTTPLVFLPRGPEEAPEPAPAPTLADLPVEEPVLPPLGAVLAEAATLPLYMAGRAIGRFLRK